MNEELTVTPKRLILRKDNSLLSFGAHVLDGPTLVLSSIFHALQVLDAEVLEI